MTMMSGLKASGQQLLKRAPRLRLVLWSVPFLATGCAALMTPSVGIAQPPAVGTAQSPVRNPMDEQGVIDRSDGVLTQQWVCDAGSGLGSFVQFTHYSTKHFLGGKTSMRETFRVTPGVGFTDFYYTDQPHIVMRARGDANGNTQWISFNGGPYNSWTAFRNGAMSANAAANNAVEQFVNFDVRAKMAMGIASRECTGGPFPESLQVAIAIPRQDGTETDYAAVQMGNTRLDVYRDSFRGTVNGVRVSGSGDLFKTVLIGRANSNFITFRINGVDVPAYSQNPTVLNPVMGGLLGVRPDPTPDQQAIFEQVKKALKQAEPIMSFEHLRDNGYFPSDRGGNLPSVIQLFKPQN